MSTAGLELSSFINPTLTWKTVSKGRSTLKRSRRTVLKNSKMGHEQNKSPKRLESQVPETGKATDITRRFGDSMEHIPIKKRRFLFRSPSPPPQSPRDETGELERSTCVSDQPTIAVPKKSEIDSSNVETLIRDAVSPGNDGKNITADEVCACGDDFSGIAILAACIDMLDKPSVNTVSAFEESVTKEQINLPKEHIVDDSLPVSFCVTGQTAERTKTSTASCDDRLHWDLNAPMDEWDHPLDDTIVDSTMKFETATVDCSVEKEQVNVCTAKEPSLQPSISGVNTDVAFSDVTHNVSGSKLAQKRDSHTGNSGLITDAAELNHNASDISQIQVVRVKTSEKQCIGPSSCMKDEPIPSGVSHVQVVDRYQIDHCLCLGSNDTKMSLSGGKRMVIASDLQDVAIEGSSSTVQVNNTEKSVMNLLLKPVSMEGDFDTDNAPREVMKNSTKTVNLDEMKTELSEIPIQHYPMASEKQDLALSTVRVSLNEAPDKCFNNTSLCKVNKEPAGTSKCSEVNTDMSNPMGQSSDASQLDAEKCETDSLQRSDFEEQTCNIHVSNCDDIAVPEKKSELDCSSSSICDVSQYVEPYSIGSERGITKLKCAGTSCYSSNSEDVGASTSNDGKSAKYHCGVEMKNDYGIFVDHEAQIRMKIENTLPAKGDDSHVDLIELPSGDSSDHVLRLQVSHEECSQVVSTGLDGGGYDSYLEDGELREHHWVDNDGKNRESEHVDYAFDNRDENKFTDAANRPTAEKVVAVVCEKQANQLHEDLQCDELPTVEKKIEEDHSYPHHDSFLAGDDVGEDCLKANPSTLNPIFTSQLSAMDNPEVVDMDLDDGRKSSIVSDDPKEDENDCFKDIGDVYIEGAGMKDSRREAPFSTYRRGNHVNPRSRYSNFSHPYYRDERQIGVDESLGRGRSLHPDYGGRVGNRYWNRGQRSIVLDHSTEGGDEKFIGPSDDESLGAHQQGMFHGSRGGHTHQKRSPAGRAEGYDMGLVKARDVTSESGQRNNRYDRHHLTGLSRGPREGYRGPIYEAPNSSNHFIKRERSFSPGGSGVDTHPPRSSHRRSRSRSRTQSPDLRLEDRMGRPRVQYQNPDNFRERRGAPFRVFGQGHIFDNNSGRLRSENCLRPVTRPVRFLDGPPSGRPHEYENGNDCKRKAYPPRSYRRSSRSKSRSCSPEFRNEGRMGRMRPPYAGPSHTRDNNLNDRRSPQRMFHSGKRFDNNVGSPPSRLRSGGGGDYMRPIGRPMRFQDNAQPSSRGNEYEGDDYRRKSRTIFERIHPTRNFDMEGDGRRFEYDAEDGSIATQSFHRGDNYARSADRRTADVSRGPREETGGTRYTSESMYSAGSKQFGNRDYSDDALPRRLRPE